MKSSRRTTWLSLAIQHPRLHWCKTVTIQDHRRPLVCLFNRSVRQRFALNITIITRGFEGIIADCSVLFGNNPNPTTDWGMDSEVVMPGCANKKKCRKPETFKWWILQLYLYPPDGILCRRNYRVVLGYHAQYGIALSPCSVSSLSHN